MTGWDIRPFLVPDDTLDRLIDAYGSTRPGVSTRPAPGVRSVPDAAASIANAAQTGMARRMHQVRCASYVWVRLEGGQHAQDLMVALDRGEEEAWQEAPTRH
jgi:hypothetical protein